MQANKTLQLNNKDLQDLASKAYQGSSTQYIEKLNTNLETGLSQQEVKLRQEKWGLNRLQEAKKEGILSKLLNQFKDVMVLLLLFAAFVSGLQGEVIEAVVIFAILVVNALLGILQEGKAEKALEALQKMSAPMARVLREGEQHLVPAEELVIGDIVLLEAGDIVPADLRLLESVNLKAEEASLTGESVPVEKNAHFYTEKDLGLGDRENMLYSSTFLTYGRGKGLVVACATHTEMGKIAHKLQSIDQEETPLQRSLESLGKILAILCIVICALVFLEGIWKDIPALLQGQWSSAIAERMTESFKISVSLAVAAVPEGLAAIVTIVLALGMKRMAERNAIVKRLLAVETLGCVDVICSDKTGTLTQNAMTVTKIFVGENDLDVSGIGYAPQGDFSLHGTSDTTRLEKGLRQLLQIAYYCNDAQIKAKEDGSYSVLGDPTEAALITLAQKFQRARGKVYLNAPAPFEAPAHTSSDLAFDVQEDPIKHFTLHPRLFELPFDSDRKRMTVVLPQDELFFDTPEHIAEASALSLTKGAPDLLLARCSHVWTSQGILPLTEEKRQKILAQNNAYASEALRVLAFAYRLHASSDTARLAAQSYDLEDELIFMGLVGMIDPARPDAKAAIARCSQAGIRAIMITGDYKDTAHAIARDLGLVREGYERVITGQELDQLSDEDLQKAVEECSVFARVSPEHKVRIISALRATNHIASMTGDGVNDAPALKQADIGVAMGITGTDVAKGAADMILMDDNFASIVKAVEEGRVIYSNIRKFVGFLLSCNVAEILVIFVSTMLFGFSPLESIQLLWLNLITDSFPALALGNEFPDQDIMEREPRKKNESIINKDMIGGILVQSASILFAVLMVFWLNNSTADHTYAKTMAFTTLVFAELLRAYSCRSEHFSVFSIGIFKNRTMVFATLFSFLLLLLVLYIPGLNLLFKTLPLGWSHWVEVLFFGCIPFAAGEIYKIVKRYVLA